MIGLHFEENECVYGYTGVLEEQPLQWSLLGEIYSDPHTIFFSSETNNTDRFSCHKNTFARLQGKDRTKEDEHETGGSPALHSYVVFLWVRSGWSLGGFPRERTMGIRPLGSHRRNGLRRRRSVALEPDSSPLPLLIEGPFPSMTQGRCGLRDLLRRNSTHREPDRRY